MGALRNYFGEHRRLLALLIGLALAMKLLVPAGYMLDRNATAPVVVICPDANGMIQPKQTHSPNMTHMGHDMAGKSGPDVAGHGKDAKHGSTGACPYSVLPMASLAGADAILLAIVLAFILVLGFAPVQMPHLARRPHLRPPLRGPPASV